MNKLMLGEGGVNIVCSPFRCSSEGISTDVFPGTGCVSRVDVRCVFLTRSHICGQMCFPDSIAHMCAIEALCFF